MLKSFKKFFRSYQGRHFLSRHARKIFERASAQQILGLGLALLVFSFSILAPQTLAYVDTIQITDVSPSKDVPIETTTEVTFRYPLENFAFSQGFSWYHWGIDLTADEGEAIFPIARGKILETGTSSWGYGNYILVDHQNGQRSLYAHLSKQEVKPGDEVGKETIIGRIGHTGWATGNHLHLEIYSGGLPLNPLEVLPER
ncbi:M23 family metallopeptidase [Candidatus Gottesmanbacteria bacterium]|nr:M23 family metallopeptidase [Candidatus Gottesmanbacteria bacterium]